MISWIQRTFAKHTKLVFLFLLIVITIPFVFTIGAAPGLGKAGTKELNRPFFGMNLDNPEQARRLSLDASLSIELKAGYSALQGNQAQQYALQRVAGLAVADQLHLPVPTANQIAKYVTTLRKFQNEQGQFDQKRYTSFGDSLKTLAQITTSDVNRVLRDDTRLDQLSKIVGGPGYVLPSDVKQQIVRADSTWTAQVATLDYATFNPTITITEDSLKKFYEEYAYRYDVPSRPRFSYVEFKGADFIPAGGPTETDARAFYLANAASFPVPADPAKKDAAAPAPSPTDDFLKVRSQVESAMKTSASVRLSSKAASDLTLALYERKLTANSPELASFLASLHSQVVPVAPFSPDFTPKDKSWLGAYADQIARLSKDRFFSDPLVTNDSHAVLLWNETLPAYKPLFSEMRDQVVIDFKDFEKRRLYSARGRALQAQLQAAATKSAAEFASVATAEKLEVKSYANFTLRQPPTDMPQQAFGLLQRLQAGQVSEMAATAEKGYLVFAQEKKIPDLSPTSPRYLEAQKQLMLFTASAAENSYLGDLVEKELKKTAPVNPR